MKRVLLSSAILVVASIFGCRDTPVSPTPESIAANATSPNPPPSAAVNSVRLNLAERFRWRPAATRDVISGGSTIAPAAFAATLRPGQTATDAMTISLPAAPPKGDVLFVVDLTGSMGGALTNLKGNAAEIMRQVSTAIPDANFGLVSHEDYPGSFTTSTSAGQDCNYSATYGSASLGDLPYRLDRAITSDLASVGGAIDGMQIKGGSDGPEGYSRALFETYNDPNVAWRNGAKRIVVSFGDNIPHDCNYDFANVLPASKPFGGASGNDPGPDNTIGTGDDLHIRDVLNGMKDRGITLVTIHNGSYNALWNSYAQLTGGSSYQVNFNGSFPTGVDPAAQITSLITSAVSKVAVLRMEVCSADVATYGTWLVSSSPASYTDVTLPASKDFTVTLGPPAGQNLQNGDHVFHLCAMGDGVEYGRQTVTIMADGTTTFIPGNSPDPIVVTVTENGKAVAGIRLDDHPFDEDVSITARFVPTPCHQYLLAQTGRCLEIDAKKLIGTDEPILKKPAIAGVCLPSHLHLELFKFESSTDRPVPLEQSEAPFLDCNGFTGSVSPAKSWLGGLPARVASGIGSWLAPKPLYAAHVGFGGVIPAGGGLSFFTWAPPMAFASAGLLVNPLRSGTDGFALSGAFAKDAKGFPPFADEAGFDPTRDAVTIGFGKSVYVISGSSFRWTPPVKRWVYAGKNPTGITAMAINPVDGTFTVAATVPTESPAPTGTSTIYRPFNIQIGHRAQGLGLKCDATRICKPQEP